MDDSLRRESENLARSWARHDPAWLREYLVAGVEDPRINVQSVLSRQFLIRTLSGDRFAALLHEECRFAAVMNWVAAFTLHAGDPEQLAVLLHTLRRNADNAEGAEIPHYVRRAFSSLPAHCGGLDIPNYVEQFLTHTAFPNGAATLDQSSLNTFQQLWYTVLSSLRTPHSEIRTLLEPACGSANDYRFLRSFGLARFFDYTGFDLSEKNIQNARALFPAAQTARLPDRRMPAGNPPSSSSQHPGAGEPARLDAPRFLAGNVFEIPADDKSFDLCLVHDLFEHLSLAGLETAVKEICRVTRDALCLGFFQMDEIPDHIVRPIDDYHVNLLSLARIKTLFARCNFHTQAIHIGTFLHSQFGCEFTHNPHAYTLMLTAV